MKEDRETPTIMTETAKWLPAEFEIGDEVVVTGRVVMHSKANDLMVVGEKVERFETGDFTPESHRYFIVNVETISGEKHYVLGESSMGWILTHWLPVGEETTVTRTGRNFFA